MDMSNNGRFAYSKSEMYCNDKGFIMIGESLKFLCAILNSTLITWLMKSTALTTGLGLIQWKKFAVERLPIPKVNTAGQRPFVQLVDSILFTDVFELDAEMNDLEDEINWKVYELYALTPKERHFITEVVKKT